MTAVLKTMTREIATCLITEVIGNSNLGMFQEPAVAQTQTPNLDKTGAPICRQQLRVNEMAKRNHSRLSETVANTLGPLNEKPQAEGLAKAEEKLSTVLNQPSNEQERSVTDIEKRELDDFDGVDIETIEKLEERGYKVIYPNLKYSKPKYQNVNELLKYVESDTGRGDGIKLVIMNFND